MKPAYIGAAIIQYILDKDMLCYASLESCTDKIELKFYANSQENLIPIRHVIGDVCRKLKILPSVWKKGFSDLQKWWVYTTNVGDLLITVYGIADSPPTCTVEYVDVPYEVPEMVPTGAMVTKILKKAIVHCNDE